MPHYDYACDSCGAVSEVFRKIDDRHNAPACCGAKMRLLVTGPYVRPDIQPYYDDDLGTYVKSRQHHKRVMRDMEVADKRDYQGQRWKN